MIELGEKDAGEMARKSFKKEVKFSSEIQVRF